MPLFAKAPIQQQQQVIDPINYWNFQEQSPLMPLLAKLPLLKGLKNSFNSDIDAATQKRFDAIDKAKGMAAQDINTVGQGGTVGRMFDSEEAADAYLSEVREARAANKSM